MEILATASTTDPPTEMEILWGIAYAWRPYSDITQSKGKYR
jgi:hypothetical protein